MGCDRICYVLPSAYGYFDATVEAYGGGARQLSMISRAQTDQFDVHFVVEDAGQPKTVVRDGVTLHRSYDPGHDTPRWKKPVQFLKLFDAMRRANADVYLYRGRPFLATTTYVVAKLLGAKWVYNLGNDSNFTAAASLPRPLRELFGRALTNADAIITQTEAQQRRMEETYNTTSTVIPSGYAEADSLLPHDEREHVLWIGRLEEDQKRPHLFLDIAESVPDTPFVLIGPAPSGDDYAESIISRSRALHNVSYHGWIPPDDVHEFYREAIALINTSAYEGFPSTFLEAWRYDTPTVSLSIPPSRYATGVTDALYADGSIDALESLVAELASNPERRTELSRPTYEYFKRNLTLEHVAERYAALFNSL